MEVVLNYRKEIEKCTYFIETADLVSLNKFIIIRFKNILYVIRKNCIRRIIL